MKKRDHNAGAEGINRHNFVVLIAQSGGEVITLLVQFNHNLGVAFHKSGAGQLNR